jgi:hypothetical protein
MFLNSHAVCRCRRAPPPWSVFYLRAFFGSKSFLHSIPRSFYMSAPHYSSNISISDRHHHHRITIAPSSASQTHHNHITKKHSDYKYYITNTHAI